MKAKTLFFSLFFIIIYFSFHISTFSIYAQLNKNEELINAVKEDDFDYVKILLQDGADINYEDSNKASVFMWAVYSSSSEIIKYLYNNGAGFNDKGVIYTHNNFVGSLLNAAIQNYKFYNTELIEYLIDTLDMDINKCAYYPYEKNYTAFPPLIYAIDLKKNDIIIFLLERGAELIYKSKNTNYSAINAALQTNNPEIKIVKTLFAYGAEFDLKSKDNMHLIDTLKFLQLTEIVNFLINPIFSEFDYIDLELFELFKRKVSFKEIDIFAMNSEGQTLLNYIICKKRFSTSTYPMVKYFIQNKVNPNVPDYYGMTPVTYALINRDYFLFEFLLNNNARYNIYIKNVSLFAYSVIKRFSEFSYLLLNKGAIFTNEEIHSYYNKLSLLHYSILSSDTTMSLFLIRNGSNINSIDSIGSTPLIYCSQQNNLFLTKYLIDKGANINFYNKKGKSALIYAIENNNIEIINYLISKGAFLNDSDLVMKNGECLLNVLINNKNTEMVKSLLQKNIDTNVKDSLGNTPLHIAVSVNDYEIINLLLKKGSIIDEVNIYNITPLSESVLLNNYEMSNYLIERGANPFLNDFYNRNVINILRDRNCIPLLNKIDSIYTIKNINFENYSKLILQSGHLNGVNSIIFSKSKNLIYTSGDDNSIKIWDIKYRKIINSVHFDFIPVLKSLSPNEDFLLIEMGDFNKHSQILIDSKTLQIIKILDLGNIIRFSQDSRYLYIDDYNSIYRYEILSSTKYMVCNDTADIQDFEISKNEKYLAIYKYDSTISIFDLGTSKVIKYLKNIKGYGHIIPYENDDFIIYTIDKNYLHLINSKDYDIIKSIKLEKYESYEVKIIASNKYLAIYKNDNSIKIYDLLNGTLVKTINSGVNNITGLSFDKDNNYLVYYSDFGVTIYDLKKNDILLIKSLKIPKISYYFTSYKNSIINIEDNGDKYLINSISLDNFGLKSTKVNNFNYRFYGEKVSFQQNVESKLTIINFNNIIYLLDPNSLKINDSINVNIKVAKTLISNDGFRIYFSDIQNNIYEYCLDSHKMGKIFNVTKGSNYSITSMSLSYDNKYLSIGLGSGSLKEIHWIGKNESRKTTLIVFDISVGQEIASFNEHEYGVNKVIFSPKNYYLASASDDGNIIIYDFINKRILKKINPYKLNSNNLFDYGIYETALIFSKDGKYLIIGDNKGFIHIVDMNTLQIIKSLKIMNYEIESLEFDNTNELLLCSSDKGEFNILETQNYSIIAKMFYYNNNSVSLITSDKYYFCNRNGLNLVSYLINDEVFSFEQFDLQYNRPDIVLERIGLADPELIKAYREAYYKRLKKLNFKEEWFKPDFHLPELKIVNKDSLWGKEITDKNITLRIEATDTAYTLDRINVFVNEVPIFGTNGISLRDRDTYNFNEDIQIELSDSINKVQVSVLNSVGVESLKDFFDVTYKPELPYKPKTYFVGIGVSNYQNNSYILHFARKDIEELSDLFKNKDPENTKVFNLLDDNATRENILNLKNELMQTNVNDVVIVSLSGHGIINKKYDFYYATWDMDFQNPEKYGLLFDDLDKLLDSIPARKKILLIDACNSGEVDKDTIQNAELGMKNEERKEQKDTIKTKGDIPEALKKLRANSKLGLTNSFELMQEIFVNLTRGNGAVVIAAARGYEPALEDISYGSGNGAFTACILELFNSKKPGEHITVTELKDYVIKRVEEITNGNQKPTTRRENLEYDFVVW